MIITPVRVMDVRQIVFRRGIISVGYLRLDVILLVGIVGLILHLGSSATMATRQQMARTAVSTIVR